MQKKKRFLALLLALVVALPFIQSPLTAQAAGEGSITRKITVVKGKDINDIQYDGKNVLHSSAWWYDDDGTKHPAFCVDPKLAGPGEIAAGKYDVNVTVKYSLQGTTQSRYLMGGVPPVRFTTSFFVLIPSILIGSVWKP